MAAGIEVGAGVAALAVPHLLISLLLGITADAASRMTTRVLGVALIALAFCCWKTRADAIAASRAGTVTAMTFYNAGAAALLVTFAAVGTANGFIVWVVAALHAALAAAFIAARRWTPSS